MLILVLVLSGYVIAMDNKISKPKNWSNGVGNSSQVNEADWILLPLPALLPPSPKVGIFQTIGKRNKKSFLSEIIKLILGLPPARPWVKSQAQVIITVEPSNSGGFQPDMH